MNTLRVFGSVIAFWSFIGYASVSAKQRLTPEDIPQMFLQRGRRAEELQKQFEMEHLSLSKAFASFDWRVNLNTNYQVDRSQQFSAAMILGATFRQSVTSASLSKSLRTGSIFGFEYNHITQWNMFEHGTPISAITGLPLASIMSQDVIGLTFEQSLLGNAFGRADRALIQAAGNAYDSSGESFKTSLQQAVVEAARAYWDAYVAQETHRAAGASRLRYQELVTRIQRKSSLGATRPGELAQVRAEFESQNQAVRRSATDLAGKIAALKTLLTIPADRELEFVVSSKVPEPPKGGTVVVQNLRVVKAQKLKALAAAEGVTAAKSLRYPSLNLVGKLFSTGFGRTAAGAWSETLDGNRPRYYAGLKLSYNFGADLQREEVMNKNAQLQMEETKLSRQTQEQLDNLMQTDLKVKANHANVESAFKQNSFRQEAVRELSRAHWQGRVDIKVLIDAINNQFASEVLLAQAIANYQTSLLEWSATRDQLLP